MKVILPTDIKQKAMKMTVDGIIDVLYRMWLANADDNGYKDFRAFCLDIQEMSADEFYALKIIKNGEKENLEHEALLNQSNLEER